jgi:oxidase EvaA
MNRRSSEETVKAIRQLLFEQVFPPAGGSPAQGALREKAKLIDLFISKTMQFSLHADGEVDRWLKERMRKGTLRSQLAPVNAIDQWEVDPATANIRHRTGRFFSIIGLAVRHRTLHGELAWDQPIIDQPEYGILGILAGKSGGVLHFLLQAKEEPGNINSVQLSPTVQATYSNYTQVHGGNLPPYLEHFLDPQQERILFAKLQSEDGGRFLFKANRNMIIMVEGELPAAADDFIWLTLRQIGDLLRRDNVINACTRSILSSVL